MKNKKLLTALVIALLICFALSACEVSFTLTFETNGGSAIQSQTVKSGKLAVKPQDPAKTGYTFRGWFKDAALDNPFDFESNSINANTTVYAKWTPSVYIITYDYQGGYGDAETDEVTYNAAYALTVPTYDHFNFMGWYSAPEGDGIKYTGADGVGISVWTDTSDITLYAFWALKTNVISLDANGGSVETAEITVISGDAYILPVPVYEYNDFLGWFDANENPYTDREGNSLTAWNGEGDITLYARWLRVTFLITLDVNGGDELIETEYFVTLNEAFTLPVAVKDDFSFGGWFDADENPYTDNQGNSLSVWVGEEDITLYARWNEILPTEGLSYIFNPSNNTYGVAVGSAGEVEHIVIPAEYEGYPVSNILTNGFQNCTLIKSIKLPETIIVINGTAFSGCSSLENINFPDSITTIGSSAFSKCSALKTVILGKGVVTVSNYAFEFCSALETLIIYGNGTNLGQRAFDNTGTIDTVIMDNVSSISMMCFTTCTIDTLIIRKTASNGIITLGANRGIESVNRIYLPDQVTLDVYKDAPAWSSFASKMEVNPNPNLSSYHLHKIKQN